MKNEKKSFEITFVRVVLKEKMLPLDPNELSKMIEMIADDVRLTLYQRICKFCKSCKSEYEKMLKILQGSDKFVQMEKVAAQLPPKYHEHNCYMTAPFLIRHKIFMRL